MVIVADMAKKKGKHPGGRPRTMESAYRLTVWIDKAGAERMRELSTQWHCSLGEVIRRLLTDSTKTK